MGALILHCSALCPDQVSAMRQFASYLPRYGARDCAQGLPPVPGTFGYGSESAQYVTLYILALRFLSTRREYRPISATLMIRLMVRADVHFNAWGMARDARVTLEALTSSRCYHYQYRN